MHKMQLSNRNHFGWLEAWTLQLKNDDKNIDSSNWNMFLTVLTHPGCCTLNTTSVWCRSARWYLHNPISHWYCKGGDFIILELQKFTSAPSKVIPETPETICCHREPRLWQIHQLDAPRRASSKLAKQKHEASLVQNLRWHIHSYYLYIHPKFFQNPNWMCFCWYRETPTSSNSGLVWAGCGWVVLSDP